MAWFSLVPAFAAALVLLLLPGLVVGRLIGLRGLWLVAVAPAVSLTLFVFASLLLPLVALRWTPLMALSAVAVLGALVVLLFRLILRTRFVQPPGLPPEQERTMRLFTLVAWAIAALILTVLFALGIGSPTAFSQTYDNVFHLNLVVAISQTGDASPLVAGWVGAPQATTAFYPNVWHALVALVQDLSGAGLFLSVNATNFAILAVVCPTGLLLLVRLLVGRTPAALIGTGALAGALPAFPMNLLHFGVLYPSFLGFALVPAVFAVLLQLLGLGKEPAVGSKLALGVLFLGVLPAITLAHPSAMMVVLAFSLPAIAVLCFVGWRDRSRRQRVIRLLCFIGYALFGLAMLVVVRAGSFWVAEHGVAEGLWQTLSLSLLGQGIPIVLAALMLTGVWASLRGRTPEDLVLVGVWAVGAVLYFIAVSVDFGPIRSLLVGVWYSDPPRLAAIYAIAVVPMAVRGFVWLASLRGTAAYSRWLPAALSACLIAVYLMAGWPALLVKMQKSYDVAADSRLLSTDEVALLERLPELVPEDAVIAGNPWTGSALAFAFAGREVLIPYIGAGLTPDEQRVVDELSWAEDDPAFCEALDASGVRYVLDFGSREVHGGRHVFAGLERLGSSDAAELVAAEGDAKLYRVTACGLG